MASASNEAFSDDKKKSIKIGETDFSQLVAAQ